MLREKIIIFLLVIAIIPMAIGNFRFIAKADEVGIITSPWSFSQNGGASEQYQNVDKNILIGKSKIKISYNLHGICLMNGDASAIIFDQDGWKIISLSNFGENCKDGDQTVEISLSDFKDINSGQVLDVSKPLTGVFHVRFWHEKSYSIDIKSVTLLSSLALQVNLESAYVSPHQELTDHTTPAPTIPISASPLSVSPTPITLDAYTGEYFDNQILSGYPKITRPDGKIDFTWNGTSPDPTIPADHYSVRWKKNVHLNAGKYIFSVFSDDGIRVYVDGKKIIDKWIDQIGSRYTITKHINSGNHEIMIEYYENTGNATVRFEFKTKSLDANITITPTPVLNITPIPSPVVFEPSPAITSIMASPVPVSSTTWEIRSIDAMKETKDVICGQRDMAWIEKFVDKAVELGANYVAISTPYENPGCGDASAYTKMWVQVIRSRGLKVWFRQMPLAFEGIYNTAKNNSSDFLSLISQYIKSNADNYQAGDIFTPIPEPQNGGIQGVTYCANYICQFSSKEVFNTWLRNAMTSAETAFQSIGKSGQMKIGYFGFDGFVAWGDNNPDWDGILEDATVKQMGNITIDHYPELVGGTMSGDLAELEAKYPGVPIIIGEWGTVTGLNAEQQIIDSMGAAKRPSVKGFNYWHMGPGGTGEQLINDDFSNRLQFDEVQSYFK